MIYHIVTEKEFKSQYHSERYLPLNFDDNGFVHCALEQSVIPVANDYYGSMDEKLLLLRIDPSKLESQIRFEAASPVKGASVTHTTSAPVFPHVYGPINNSSIDGIGVMMKGKNGYAWPNGFFSINEFINRKI